DADDAAADDDGALRDLVELESLVAGHDAAADLDAERARLRAGRQHDVGAGVALAVDLDGRRVDEPALALDDRDASGLHQTGQALVEPVDDALLVGVDLAHVDAVEGRVDADLVALTGGLGDLGGVQQGLGGDA